MGSAGDDEDGRRPPVPPANRKGPDRRAEALRANLKRRKAQTRARDDARGDAPQPGEPGREG